MDKKECVINPKTGRAVKADSKIGKMILGGKPKAEPKKVEPKKVEPKKVEPKKVEPKKAEPKKVEPKKVEPKKVVPKKVEPKKVEPKKVEPKKVEPIKPEPMKEEPKTDLLKNLVEEWDTASIGILFYQTSHIERKLQSFITKIENIYKKGNHAIIPSDLFSFYPELLNKLVEYYGATKKGIEDIDEGMRSVILYINEEANLPKGIDYKYYMKYMNTNNKKKLNNNL